MEWLSLVQFLASTKQTGCAALKQAGGNIAQGSEREKGKFQQTGEMHDLQALQAQFTNRCNLSAKGY
jgi:hypothetical protein